MSKEIEKEIEHLKKRITLLERQISLGNAHKEDNDVFIDRGLPRPHGCLPNCPECKYAREYYRRNKNYYYF